MRNSERIAAVTIIASLAVLGAGCGGSEDGGGADTAPIEDTADTGDTGGAGDTGDTTGGDDGY